MPNAQDLTEIRGALTRVRTSALARLATLERELAGLVKAADTANLDDEHDPEGSTIGFERAQVAALIDQARSRLRELERALRRLSDGTYGACEHCGNPIGLERLQARPGGAPDAGLCPGPRRPVRPR